jgi:uncharacterized protein YpuA (DUF1002 family)
MLCGKCNGVASGHRITISYLDGSEYSGPYYIHLFHKNEHSGHVVVNNLLEIPSTFHSKFGDEIVRLYKSTASAIWEIMECIQEHVKNNGTGIRLIGDNVRRVPGVKITERNPNKIDEFEKEIINIKSKIRHIERRIENMETNLIHAVLDTVMKNLQIKSRVEKNRNSRSN